MKRLLAALVAVALAAVAFVAPGALAQENDESSQLRIRAIDSRDPSSVAMVVGWTGDEGALDSATIVENGNERSPSEIAPLPGGLLATVLVIDNSQPMDQGGALVQARDAAAAYIAAAPEGEIIGLVSLGGSARVVQRLTTDRDRLLTVLDDLAPTGQSALWNGIDSASRMLGTAEGREGNVVVIAGGPNGASTVSQTRARGSAISQEVTVSAVGLVGRGLDEAGLRNIVDATGGIYNSQENPTALVDATVDVGTQIASQYVVTYSTDTPAGPVDLSIQVGDEQADASFVSGGVAKGSAALRPIAGEDPAGWAFFRDNGFVLGLVLVVLAVALAVFAIVSLLTNERTGLDVMLEQYTEPNVSSYDDDEGTSGLAHTAFIQRAVSITEGFAERQGLLAKVEGMLERANLPLRAAEALFFYFAAVIVLALLAFAFTGGNLLLALVAAGVGALLPPAIVNFLASRRQKKFVAQLPDMLQLLAGTLRAGYSLMQGVEAVSGEVPDPMGHELRRVVTESRLGRPLDEALQASADRMQSADFEWAVMAIGIQREVGGNLAELLLTVGDTMVQRERLRRDVAALTAEGKISAIVLGLLPPGLAVAMWMMNPDYIAVLFDTTLGNILLGGAVVLACIGFYWMKKVIEIDV